MSALPDSIPVADEKCNDGDEFYSRLNDADASFAIQVAHEVRGWLKELSVAKVGVGQHLLRVKERLEHGEFVEWLKLEFKWHVRTAQRYMAVAKALGDECDTLSYLPFKTLIALAKATPAVRDEILSEIQAGRLLNPPQIALLLGKGKTCSKSNAEQGLQSKAQDVIEELRSAVDRVYGMASRTFVEGLLKELDAGSDLASKLRSKMRSFAKKSRVSINHLSARQQKAFALIYACGRVAREMGVLPKEWGKISDAVRHVAGMTIDPDPAASASKRIEQYLRVHRSKIISSTDLPKPVSAQKFQSAYGWLFHGQRGLELIVPSHRLQQEFPDCKSLMQELRKAGRAITEEGKRPKLTTKTPKKISSGGRVYRINLPSKP